VSKGEAKVLVAEGDLGRVGGTPAIEGVISNIAANTGIPPQFLKAQARVETNFTPDRVKYESASIDFRKLGRDGADWKRSPASGSVYLQRHLREGQSVGDTDVSVCVVIAGAAANPTPATTADCTRIAVSRR
jgi:hypothetical protein